MSKRDVSYDEIAEWFDKARSRDFFEKAWIDKALSLIPSQGSVLDLGCGMGEPIGAYIDTAGYEVTGLDASGKLLEKARARIPRGVFHHGDMRMLDLSQTFNLIIAWHSFFHLTKDGQRKMFPLFVRHLIPGGVLLFTSGPQDGEVWSDNGGKDLYHASLDPAEYKTILAQCGFALIEYAINDKACGGATVWLAQKKI